MMNGMNPLQLIKTLRGGGNPLQMLMGMAQQNPMLKQVMDMVNGKTPEEMRDFVYQTAQQRGVDVNQLAQTLGIELPT